MSNPSANLVTSTLDIYFESNHPFFPLPHSHLGPRNHHLFLGSHFFPFIPVASSQHSSHSKTNLTTSLLRHPFWLLTPLGVKANAIIWPTRACTSCSMSFRYLPRLLLPLSSTSFCSTHSGLQMVFETPGFCHHRAFALWTRTEILSPQGLCTVEISSGYLHAQSSAPFSSLWKHRLLTEGPPGRPI